MAYSLFKRKLETKHYYLIFGHRHLPMKVSVGENAEYVNLTGLLILHLAFFDGTISKSKVLITRSFHAPNIFYKSIF
jgi:hypothetical protein